MLPHEKELVKLQKDKPFALLGINSDPAPNVPETATPEERARLNAENVRRILKEQSITWRQAVDVDTEGKLATKWNVNGWPTIFVIDAKGVIRYRDVRDQQMEDAVLKLIAEAGPK